MDTNRVAKSRFAVVVPLAAVLLVAPVRAATWYVAPGGDDAADCQTVATPCLTIGGGVGKAAAGDTVLVAAGTYAVSAGAEVVLVDKSLALSGGWDTGFSLQDGTSVIDGGGARRGLKVAAGADVVAGGFTIRNGFSAEANAGGGVFNAGTLTLDDCTVTGNRARPFGGGIFNAGTLATDATSVSGNTAGWDGHAEPSGGGGIFTYGPAVLTNSTVSANVLLGKYTGSGIFAWISSGALELYNTTVSGNSGGSGDGIRSWATVVLANSTITANQKAGLVKISSHEVSLQNTIIAGNGANRDCSNTGSPLASGGYNLVGSGDGCAIAPGPGDKIGTAAAPLDAQLLPLQPNGGPTPTHGLRAGSPALDAGNPAAPGSGGGACLAEDQRGVPRPAGSACDIGAFEGFLVTVASITRASANPTSASSVEFTVTFTKPVTGVELAPPFADFAVTTSGVTSGAVSAVSGSGETYTATVAVNTHSGNGTLRLDVVDDDSIVDGDGAPLGGGGVGNGTFTAGQRYSVVTIPVPRAPAGKVPTDQPEYRWSTVPGATSYRYQIFKGTAPIGTRTVPAAACGGKTCTDTPPVPLGLGAHQWRVQAMTDGAWRKYSAFKPFTVTLKPGFWEGYAMEYYVTPDSAGVDRFAVYVRVEGCGDFKITHIVREPIAGDRFAWGGEFYASGTFSGPTTASGLLGLDRFFFPGCGYATGGPFSWSAAWDSPGLPSAGAARGSDLVSVAAAPGSAAAPFVVQRVGAGD